jgi:hypothetical protein
MLLEGDPSSVKELEESLTELDSEETPLASNKRG